MGRLLRAAPTALFLLATVPPLPRGAAAGEAPPAPTAFAAKAAKKSAAKPRRAKGGAPRIRRIRVVRREIFDVNIPAENRKLFRLINTLHVSTKESAIREQLLLKEGDSYDADLAGESERAVRRILRLRNVKVTPVPINPGTVDLLVTTQETWTTEPVLGVTGVGSNLNVKAGIRERNLFGYGKSGSYFYRKTDGVISRSFSYDDPALLGTPLVMSGDYEDNEDGNRKFLSLQKPFRATVTPWALGGEFSDVERETKVLDNLGEETALLRKETRALSSTLAFSMGSTTRLVRRPRLGYRRLKERSVLLSGAAEPEEDAFYHVFSAGYSWESVRFLTVNRVKQYDRDEDYALGPAASASFGASRRKWVPKSQNANFLGMNAQAGRTFGPSHFGLLTVSGDGKYQKDRWRGSTVKADAEYYNHFQPRQTLALHLGWEAVVNPKSSNQVRLGGDSGLRAYKLNQFAGNKKVLANAENRFFVVDDLFRLMSLGAVVFTDAGYVWDPGRSMRLKDVKIALGTGLRVYLTRASQGHVLRFDLGYAVKRVKDQERLVFTFGTSHPF